MLSLDDQIPDLHIKIHGQAARKRLMVSIIDRALTVRLRIQDVIETGCYSLLHHEDLPHYSRRGAGCAALIKRIGLRGIPISWPEHAPRPDK